MTVEIENGRTKTNPDVKAGANTFDSKTAKKLFRFNKSRREDCLLTKAHNALVCDDIENRMAMICVSLMS